MASIINRNGKYAVVFNYTDQDGKRRQKWETFTTKKEAQAYKAKMEYAQAAGMQMFVPSAKTVDDLMAEYISQYGKQSWSHSYYDKAQSLV